jgi:hypothetical protein
VRLLANTPAINARLGRDGSVRERARGAAIAALTGHNQLSRAAPASV